MTTFSSNGDLENKILQLNTLINSVADALFVADHETSDILFVNDKACESLGYDEDELLLLTVNDINPAFDRDDLKKELWAQMVKGETYTVEVSHKTKDGNLIPVELRTALVDYEGKKAVLGYARDISNRKLAETALKESEEKFRTLSDLTFEGILVHLNGIAVNLNLSMAKMFGYQKEELLGKNIIELLIHKDYHPLVHKNISKEHTGHYFVEGIRKDGKRIHLEIEAKTVPSNGNKGIRVAAFRDISYRRMLEDNLKKSEKRFRQLFEQSGDAMLIIEDRSFVDCNLATVKMLEYNSKEEFLNVHPSALSPEFQEDGEPSASKAEEMMNLAVKNGTHRFQWIHLRKNGDMFPVEVLLTAMPQDSEKEVIHCVWRDITDQINSRNKLRQSEEKFKNAFLTSPDSININRLVDGMYVSTNHGFTALTGYAEEEVVGKTSMEINIWENPKDRDTLLEGLKRNGKVVNMHARFRMKDGTLKDALMSASITKINDVPHIISITRDISKRISMEKKLELLNKNLAAQNEEYMALNEELKKSFSNIQQINIALKEEKIKAQESDRLKSAFLANMSHEIRTPMNGILGFTSLLKNPELEGNKVQHYVEIIQKSSNRMLSTINDILDISKIEAKQVEVSYSETNINTMLDDLFMFFNNEASDKGLRLSLTHKLNVQDAKILSDEEKVNAVITNLIKNSIKYTDQGSIEFGCRKKQDQLIFFVKDTGIGIPNDRHEAIFDRFVQADIEDTQVYEGSGLGLSISKAYVEMMKGEIWVESRVGTGSSFYFMIPFKRSISGDNQQKTDTAQIKPASRKLKILIVEDEEISDNLITIILKEYSDKLLHAKNGLQAIEICKEHKDIDLIFMDIRMPSLGGYRATKEIRKFNKTVTIIAQTAYALSGDREKAIAAGCNDYIAKPIMADQLKLLINKYLFDVN